MPEIDISQLRKAVECECSKADTPGLVRVELPLSRPMDPAAWLSARPDPIKVYWADRDGKFEVAGAGAIILETSSNATKFADLFQSLRERLDLRYPHLRFYGGITFDWHSISCRDENWNLFGSHQFIIPQFEVFRIGSAWYFACNWPKTNQNFALIEQNWRHSVPPEVTSTIPQALRRHDLPDKKGWIRAVTSALKEIDNRTISKIVLARETQFELPEPLSPMAILRQLREPGHENYVFCFQPAPGHAFLSISPEQFCACTGDRVESEALAGTRPRGTSATADAALSNDLLHNEKELREHNAVVAGIRDVFHRFCANCRIEKTLHVLRLRDCQHLVCRMKAKLAEPGQMGAFLQALHPTAAVGGMPTAPALAMIRRIEPFARGWYAGPVGWVGPDAFEFAVGIRSGRIEQQTITLYAGAGIVAGSDPEREWDEVETKMQALARLILREDDGRG